MRAARVTTLVPVLRQRGLAVRERDTENFELVTQSNVRLKNSYWGWPEWKQAGNAMDP